jgi:hypothetical protein
MLELHILINTGNKAIKNCYKEKYFPNFDAFLILFIITK